MRRVTFSRWVSQRERALAADALTEPAAEKAAAPPGPAGAALELEGLVRRFGEREALSGVSARLAPAQTLVVFGPNGAGKTTLLRVLAGLLRPHGGSLRVLGSSLPHDVHAVRDRIGFASHEPLLYRELSGRENLDLYARLYGVVDREGRIGDLLAATQMTPRADDPVRTLSRGMVQRLALARAVLHRPELLLLDEPRAGLDPDAEELVEPLIGRGCGLTRVLVTHDVERGLGESDRVLGLREGRAVLAAAALETDAGQVRDLYREPGASR
jgi:heme exporter protein A